MGAFVAELCNRLDRLRNSDEAVNELYVLKSQSRGDCHSQLFVDQAVYSRNRSFRLPFSSKAGKTSQLLPSGRFRCKEMSEHEVFEDSLICRVGPECEKLLTFGSEMAGRGGSVAAGYAAGSLALNRVPKAAEFCISGRSPFPAVDLFIESIACIEGIPGKIRSWYWFSEYSVLVYNINGNRYCENIGRQHKSNHVMYIVDFRTAGYYQKCHDPDCRGYKSPLRPIPRHTIPPNFPLSMSVESCYSRAETSLAILGHEECSAGIFSCLSITNEDTGNLDCVLDKDLAFRESSAGIFSRLSLTNEDSQNLDCVLLNKGIALRESGKGEDNENAWWEDVFNSMETGGKKLSTQSINEQCGLSESFPMDEDWWELVEQELENQGF